MECAQALSSRKGRGMISRFADSFSDLRHGVAMWRVWVALATEDIGDHHRRTILGPLWIFVNYLAFAATFIFVFHRGSGGAQYAAYAATGLLVWLFMMETITRSVTLFTREESFIKGTKLPLSIYVMRLATQTVIRSGYALLGWLLILYMSGASLNLGAAWAILGILIVLLIAPAVIIIFAFLGAYYPDSQFVISNAMRLGMFVTPVFWEHDAGSGIRRVLYYWNPFTYLLDLVRVPILTGELPTVAFAFSLCLCVALWAFALSLFAQLHRDVVFVL